jgi:hypothetical protein
MRLQHIFLLGTQTVHVLTELQTLTGSGKYLFPSERSETHVRKHRQCGTQGYGLYQRRNDRTGFSFHGIDNRGQINQQF